MRMKERWMIKELPNEKEGLMCGKGVARKVNGEESDDVWLWGWDWLNCHCHVCFLEQRERESESVSGNQGAAVRVGASLPRLEPSTEEYSTPPPTITPSTLRIPLTQQQPPTLLIKAFHGLFISGKCRSWTERVESLFSGNKRARCVHNLSLRGHTKGEPLCRAFWRVKRAGR